MDTAGTLERSTVQSIDPIPGTQMNPLGSD
jgi:hypothetical protein